MQRQESDHWLKQALDSPDQTVELENDEGIRLRVEKNSDFGASLRVVELDSGGEPARTRLLQFTASGSRPAAYPSTVPFVAGVHSTIATFPPPQIGLMCSWYLPTQDETARSRHLRAALLSIAGEPGVAELATEVARLRKPPPAAGEMDRWREQAHGIGDRVRAAVGESGFRRLLAALIPSKKRLDELQRIAARVVEDSLANGWLLKNYSHTGLTRIGFRTWNLERNENRRSVFMSSFGAASVVTLWDNSPHRV